MVTKNKTEKWVLVPAAVCMIALIAVMASPQSTLSMTQDRVDYQQISPIIERRCLSCHSTQPTDDLYKEPPKGVLFGTEAQLKERADKVYLHVVLAKSMPLGNKTQMLDTERALIGRWLKQEGLAP
jgi:uncharacterized membrane protein